MGVRMESKALDSGRGSINVDRLLAAFTAAQWEGSKGSSRTLETVGEGSREHSANDAGGEERMGMESGPFRLEKLLSASTKL